MCVNNGNFSTATVNIVQRLTSGTLLFSRGTLRSERCCFLGCSAPLLTWQVKKRERSTGASGEESEHEEHGEQEGESANTSTASLLDMEFRVGGDVTGPHTWEVWSVWRAAPRY